MPDAVNQKFVNHESILALAICGSGNRAYTTDTLPATGVKSRTCWLASAVPVVSVIDGAPLSSKSVIVYDKKITSRSRRGHQFNVLLKVDVNKQINDNARYLD